MNARSGSNKLEARPDHSRQIQVWQVREQHDGAMAQAAQGSEAESGDDGCGMALPGRLIGPWGGVSAAMGRVAKHSFLPFFIMSNHLQPLAY